MTRDRTVQVCSECGATAARWAGRCAGCGEWNTLVEQTRPGAAGSRRRGFGQPQPRSGLGRTTKVWGEVERAVSLADISSDSCVPVPTGIAELDRVLSGGLVAGSVTLMGGEPGIGKSTLVLQAAASASRLGRRTLLVAAEESAEQVRRRAERLGTIVDECYIVATSDLQTALEVAGNLEPELLVVDSIQTVGDPSISSQLGSMTQVRECAQALAHFAKATGTATVLVGHVTKEGALAGPRTLEHLVDTVLSFEGDRHHALRMLTATKHRFGSAGELGLFEMAESGLVGLADPSSLLLGDRRGAGPGMVVAPIIEGRRPLLVEVQALVSATHASTPRRVVQGILPSRLALLLAVLEQFAEIPVRSTDVFVSTVAGIKVTEPAADLAVALAVASAISGVPIPGHLVAFGEIGLSGEIRQSPGAPRRLSEAERLGFSRAFAPLSSPCSSGTMKVVQVATIGEAVTALGLVSSGGPTRSRERGPAARASGRRAVVSRGVNDSIQKQAVAPMRKTRAGLTLVRD